MRSINHQKLTLALSFLILRSFLFESSGVTAFTVDSGFKKNLAPYSSSCTYTTNGNNNRKQCSLLRNYHPKKRVNDILRSSSKDGDDDDDDFWKKQQELVGSMTENIETSIKEENREKFNKRSDSLVGDTLYFQFVTFSALWLCFDNPFCAFSYFFGASFGTLYILGLGKYVATIGGTIDDAALDTPGSGLGQARFAFLILLVVLVGKLQVYGILAIPAILGFFTYQLGSLSQGLREIND